jgi:hypothetical protein
VLTRRFSVQRPVSFSRRLLAVLQAGDSRAGGGAFGWGEGRDVGALASAAEARLLINGVALAASDGCREGAAPVALADRALG